MEAFLIYKPEESTVEEISRKRDGFNVLMSNVRGLGKTKKKKESNGESINGFRTFFKVVILNFPHMSFWILNPVKIEFDFTTCHIF